MGIMRLIEGIRAGKAVSVFSGNQEYLFSAGKPGPACPDGFWEISVRCRRQSLTEPGRVMVPFYFSTAEPTGFWILPGVFWRHCFPCPLNISMIWLSLNRK